MLGQLVALQLDEMAEANLPAQRLMLERLFQLVLDGLYEYFLACVVQQAAVQLSVEMLLLNLPAVEHSEDDTVYDDGLENL